MLVFEEMTMTLSGGIAQGTGGARVEINSTIPMYNVGKGDAEVLLKVRMFLQLRFHRIFKCCLPVCLYSPSVLVAQSIQTLTPVLFCLLCMIYRQAMEGGCTVAVSVWPQLHLL